MRCTCIPVGIGGGEGQIIVTAKQDAFQQSRFRLGVKFINSFGGKMAGLFQPKIKLPHLSGFQHLNRGGVIDDGIDTLMFQVLPVRKTARAGRRFGCCAHVQ
ncbi:hypothetical protein SDC9_107362 [bioreactor metagenome]|uniref:Uncharacterized protein n=1 Tax=bioreactor metagenome TaxID=1076179 RepID=A0A645B7B9_9ZZZZ